MKKRSTEILQKLMKERISRYSISKLAKQYNVTPRTMRNDLVEINQFLADIEEENIHIDDGYLAISSDCNRNIVQQELFNMDTYSYRMSSDERQIYILVSLLQSKEYIKMRVLADELYVSRVTILSDIQALQEYLSGFGIKLLSDTGRGIIIQCGNDEKIELLIELFRHIAVNVNNEGFFQHLILKKLQIKYTFSEIFSHLQEYITQNNIIFIDEIFYDIVLYLFSVFNITNMDEEYKSSHKITAKTELSGLDYLLVYEGYMLNVDTTEHMMQKYREYLTENNLGSFVKTVDEIELYVVINYFLSKLDQELGLNLRMDEILIDSLLMHIKSMKEWGGYEVELPKEQNLAIDYGLLCQLVEDNCDILEHFLGYQFSDNMKKSIVIHICVSLIRNQRYMTQLAVVIVCPGSMATGKYLEAQIKNYFNFNILGVISAKQVFRRLEDMEHVDLIISTVSLYSEQYKVLTVRPFLTMDDMNRIQEASFECQKKKNMTPIRNKNQLVMNHIRRVMESKDVSKGFRHEMERVIDEYENNRRFSYVSAIGELIRPEFILMDDTDLDWRRAMRKAASVLEKSGYISPEYIEEGIRNVEEYGDYIIVGQGVALAHANKEYGVYKNGLSLLVSKRGVIFSDGETKVHFIFCYASTGEEEHIELLREIVSVGHTKGMMEYLLKLTKSELYHVLCSIGA